MRTVALSPVRRLAAHARARGIRVLHEPISGEYYTTSATDPERLYRVTGFSCSCPGFIRWGRCGHHALLLDHLGWLGDDDPDPTPVTPLVAREPDRLPCSDGLLPERFLLRPAEGAEAA